MKGRTGKSPCITDGQSEPVYIISVPQSSKTVWNCTINIIETFHHNDINRIFWDERKWNNRVKGYNK